MAVDVGTLLKLWHGDEDTAGYAHPEIVVAVCDAMVGTPTYETVRRRFYPVQTVDGKAVDPDIDPLVSEILVKGYATWKKRVEGRKAATTTSDGMSSPATPS